MDHTSNVGASVVLPWIRVVSPSDPLLHHLPPFLFFIMKCPKKKAAQVPGSRLTFTSLSLCLCLSVHPSKQFPEPRDGGLGNTGGLSEDHSACLRASAWALVVGLVLALVLAQHAL